MLLNKSDRVNTQSTENVETSAPLQVCIPVNILQRLEPQCILVNAPEPSLQLLSLPIYCYIRRDEQTVEFSQGIYPGSAREN